MAANAFEEYHHEHAGNGLVRLIDRYWARAWRRAREAQVRAGVLAGFSGSTTQRSP